MKISDEILIRNCAPTLAGIKTGNLFSCAFAAEADAYFGVYRINKILEVKGIRAVTMLRRRGRTLVYVYRPSFLTRDIRKERAERILQELGYGTNSAEGCVSELRHRMAQSDEFPHEIGLFLGYPPEDVFGFIKDRDGCKYSGLWKVYGDVEKAKVLFNKYKKCTDIYCSLYKSGRSIERLAVAVH